MIFHSLTKDMTGKEDVYRGPAIRALCRITDVRTAPFHFLITSITSWSNTTRKYFVTLTFINSETEAAFVDFLCPPHRPPCCRPLSGTWSRLSLTRCPVCRVQLWSLHWYETARFLTFPSILVNCKPSTYCLSLLLLFLSTWWRWAMMLSSAGSMKPKKQLPATTSWSRWEGWTCWSPLWRSWVECGHTWF